MDYRTKRKALGLTLEDIASMSGCTKQNVYKFEHGKYKNSRCEAIYENLERIHYEKYYSDTDSFCIIKNDEILED